MLDFFEPIWFDVVTETFHGSLNVTHSDLVITFLVERLERVSGRW